jgi:hypothetical protein
MMCAAVTKIDQEGEPVEYSVQQDMKGRIKADRVTGPMGSFVQGAPRRPFNDFSNNRNDYGGFNNHGDGGYNRGPGGYGGNNMRGSYSQMKQQTNEQDDNVLDEEFSRQMENQFDQESKK